MLYQTVDGDTRIRVFNMALDVMANLHSYIKSTILESYTLYLLKENLANIASYTCQQVRERLLNHTVDVLFTYRKECAKNSSPTELVIPESIKLHALYLCSALKSHALRVLGNNNNAGEIHIDQKIHYIHKYLSAPLTRLLYHWYPRIYPVTDVHRVIGFQ